VAGSSKLPTEKIERKREISRRLKKKVVRPAEKNAPAENMPQTESAHCSIDRAGCASAGWAGCP
jgi:hypothetical protein